ncbi:MAG: SagB/ThcOx family dehydrogenase [Desulfovibrio sp.]|nr:SagB/ThcOx family dehydrogenase [Desulfovibrio sp.]
MQRIALVLCLSMLSGMAGALAGKALAVTPAKEITLPKPAMSGGMPLMEALSKRKSTREFSGKPVSGQDLSNMLWAAWGVNRPDGKRTVPTSRNRQEAELFVVLESGVWRYDAAGNALVQYSPEDARSRFGGAPLTLLYAARAGDDAGGMHAGSMYQNVGLYCASVGLGNVVKSTGRAELDSVLGLPAGYKTYVVQSIGWPR